MIKQQFQNLVIWYTSVYSIRHFTVLITCNNSYIFATFCIPGISNLTAISVHIASVFFLFLFSFMPLLNKIGFSPFSCNNSILLPFVNDTLVYCISMGSTVFPSDLSSCCFGESCWNILFRSHFIFCSLSTSPACLHCVDWTADVSTRFIQSPSQCFRTDKMRWPRIVTDFCSNFVFRYS